jgi:hypothetical protein
MNSNALPDSSESYGRALSVAGIFLREIGERTWEPRLQQWLDELAVLIQAGDTAACCRHRTWFATAGMGSMGDLTVGTHNGHGVADATEADQRWLQLVSDL